MGEFDYGAYLRNPNREEGFKQGGKVRSPMPREQRAKQFAPFDALTGLHARLAIAIKEHREDSETDMVVHVELEE